MAERGRPAGGAGWLALGRRLVHSRLLIAALLWLLAFQVFSNAPVTGGAGAPRIDRTGAEAYPLADAGCDFQNALAILTGEGWVNWRSTNRWSVYKPGWGAALAVAALLTGRDTSRMQRLVTAVSSLAAPVFFYLLLALFPGPRSVPVAALASVFFTLTPYEASWSFQRQMTTEGPMLLLALLFALVAIGLGRRSPPADWRVFALGLVGGLAGLVREQSRYGVAAAVAVLLLARIRRPRLAARFLVTFACGYLLVVGPLYLKTSYHLKGLYAGTSAYALVTVLDWTGSGKAVGGSALAPEDRAPEGRALRAMSRRAFEALRLNLRQPAHVAGLALHDLRQVLFRTLGKLLGVSQSGAFFLLALVPFLAGLAHAGRRHGLDALVPLAFAFGYLLPNLLYSYFLPRISAPVSWVGLAFVAGSFAWWVDGSRGAETSAPRPPVAEPPDRTRILPRPWLPAATAAWVLAAAALLVWIDLRPRPDVDIDRLLADDRTRSVLAEAGIHLDDELRAEIERSVNGDRRSERVHTGIAHLPILIRPRDRPLTHDWVALQPRSSRYTAFFSISPWKNDGTFELFTVSKYRWMYKGFRHGDRVVAILAPPGKIRRVKSMFPRLEALAVFPVKWAEG